jgi:hypothetical protein
MRKIQSITIVTNQGVSTVSVGDDINGLIVAEIRNDSVEWDDHFDHMYTAVDENGGYIRDIINCPVDVTYYEV